MNTKSLYLITLPLLLLLLSSCNPNALFNTSIETRGSWSRFDTLVFEVNIDDIAKSHRFYVNIRNNNQYEFSNLFIFLHTSFPDGQTTHDTLEFILADKKGKWLGKGAGSIKENDILLRENLLFPQKGKYIFAVEQAMRDENLTGIESFGIRIEEIKK